MSDNDMEMSDERAARAARIKAAREHARLSQEALADELTERMGHRVRQTHVSRWERGANTPTHRYAVALSEIFEVTLGWLMLGAQSGAPVPKWWKNAGADPRDALSDVTDAELDAAEDAAKREAEKRRRRRKKRGA